MILSLSIEGSRHGPKALMPWRWRLETKRSDGINAESFNPGAKVFRAEVLKDLSSPEAICIT